MIVIVALAEQCGTDRVSVLGQATGVLCVRASQTVGRLLHTIEQQTERNRSKVPP